MNGTQKTGENVFSEMHFPGKEEEMFANKLSRSEYRELWNALPESIGQGVGLARTVRISENRFIYGGKQRKE